MKKIIIGGLLIVSIQLNAQLQITNGAEIKLSGAAVLTLQDINLVNDGTFNQTAGTVRFSGNTNTNISGSQATRFYTIDIVKGINNRVLLQRNINTGNQINFTSGYLDLNGFNIMLDPTALLVGEDETSRITGTTGGYVEITNILNLPTDVNPGNLGASITSAANLGSTIIRRGHQSQSNGTSGSSVHRYFDIIPTNNTALNATLNFKYFDAELNGLIESSLSLWKSANTFNWTDQGFTRRSAVTNYVEKSGVNDFSRWTLSNPGNALPVLFVLFNVKCNNNKVDINWKTAAEQNSSHFEVERSESGNSWTSIGTVPAAGNSSSERSYSFTDNTPLSFPAFYRIAEFDLDGRAQYTSIIKNDCRQTDTWKLWPNPVQDQLFIAINSPVATNMTINLYDAKGSLVKQQQRSILPGNNQLSIDMSKLAKGMYHITANSEKGLQQQSFKLIKQ